MYKDEILEASGDAELADLDDEDASDPETTRVDDIHVPVRWIIPSFQAIATTRGNAPIASYGESPDLTEEVTKICRAFHREATADTVAKDTPVYLFWQARSTGDWTVTQIVAAPFAGNPRGTLGYHCLVFDSHTFHVLRYNPFRMQSLNLYAQLRSHAAAGRTDPFRCTIPRRYVPASMPLRADSSKTGKVKRIPGLSSGFPADDNLRILETFCYRWTNNPTPPPTFATFWGNDAAAPDCFDIVLRGSDAAPGALRNAKKPLEQFVSQLKEVSSRVSPPADAVVASLVNYAGKDILDAEDVLSRAIAAFGAGSQLQLQNDIQEASRHLERLRTRFESFSADWNLTVPVGNILPIPWLTQYAEELASMIREISYQDATIWDPPPPAFPRSLLTKFTNPFSNAKYRR